MNFFYNPNSGKSDKSEVFLPLDNLRRNMQKKNFRCRKSPKSPKFFLCIDNALRTVSVFESLVRLGDRESHRQNQASQLTVSAIDNERTGVINSKRKTLA